MKILKNGETDTMSYNGCIEGFRILTKYKADSANTALTTVASYKNVIIDWKCDGQQVYAGDLATFIQAMFFRAFDSTKRMQYLNAEIGQVMVSAASNVYEQRIADLSVIFPSYAGNHEFIVRMNDCFPAESDGNSSILFDFDKSDDACREKFQLFAEPINISGDKAKQIVGNVSSLLFIQSDNEFIATNDGQFNGKSEHPILNCSINSVYAQCNYEGEELQVLEVNDVDGLIDPTVSEGSVTAIAKKTMQKSVRLSDREIMSNPEVNLKLRIGSMSTSVQYSLVYDIVTLLP